MKRIGLLFIFSVIGAIVFVIFAKASVNGVFVQWKNLGKPSETPIEVIRPGYIKTDTGNIYRHNYSQDCDLGCWEKVDALPPDVTTDWKLSTCGNLPSLKNYIDNKVVCEPWGVGTSLTIYAIGKDGFIYTWHHSLDEGTSMMLDFSPFFGAVAGFVVGVIVVLIGLFSDLLDWLQQRAIKKGL